MEVKSLLDVAVAAPNSEKEAPLNSELSPFPAATGGSVDVVLSALPVDHFGTTVFLKGWQQRESVKPPVVVVHDVGEHADCYEGLAAKFVSHGYSVYAYDWRGHGRSGWQLGHAPSFDVLVKDLLQVAAWARYQERGQAPVLIGHGVGALMVTELARTHGNFCRAAILSAPCLELQSSVGGMHRLMLRLLADFTPLLRIWGPFRPKFTNNKVSFHPISREDESLSAKFPGLTASLTYELMAAIKRAEARFLDYLGHVLILCPENDSVCRYQHLRKAVAVHAEHNVEIVNLAESGHSLLTDDGNSQEIAMRAILGWLTKVIGE